MGTENQERQVIAGYNEASKARLEQVCATSMEMNTK